MGVVASQSAVHGWGGEKGDGWAAVILAGTAGRAGRFGTGDSVFEGYAVALGAFSVSEHSAVFVRYVGYRSHCIGWAGM